MNMIFGKNIPRASAFALTCLALAGAEVKASAVVTAAAATPAAAVAAPSETYSTSGSIGTTGVTNSGGATGPGPVGYSAVTTGSFGLNSQVSLGGFTVSLGDGSTTTYKDTPFSINYTPVAIVGGDKSQNKFPNQPISITGVLNGSVTGSTSNVTATFDKFSKSVFSTPDGTFLSTISLPNESITLVPSTTFGGLTTIQAAVTTTAVSPPGLGDGQTVPEPTTLAILATSIVGLGLRQRLRSRTARQSA
jgi:hypothetical protein